MGRPYGEIAERIYNLLAGTGVNVGMFDQTGNEVTDSRKAVRFSIRDPYEILVRLDVDDDSIIIKSEQDIYGTPLWNQFDNLRHQYILNRTYQIFDRTLKAKRDEKMDIARARDAEQEATLAEQKFARMSGTTRTSYQKLDDSVSIVVRHRKPVDEEARGARSRNISAIYIRRGDEQFRLSENSMIAARAMARHLKNGGEIWDEVGTAITETIAQARRLSRFVNYVSRNNMLNEDNEEYVSLARTQISRVKSTLESLSRANSYARAADQLRSIQATPPEQLDEELGDKFDVTQRDQRVDDVLGDLHALKTACEEFERRIEEAIAKTNFGSVKNMLRETDIIDFADAKARLGYQVNQLSTATNDPELSTYLSNIGQKISTGGNLSHHEYGTVKRCLFSASGEQKLDEDSGHSVLDILSPEQLARLKDYVDRDEDFTADEELFDVFYDYYSRDNQMPYGTQKARTGDPYEWIYQRVILDYGDQLSSSELSEVAQSFAGKGPKAMAAANRARKQADAKPKPRFRVPPTKPRPPATADIWRKITDHIVPTYFPDGDPLDGLEPYMHHKNVSWEDIDAAAQEHGYNTFYDYWHSLGKENPDYPGSVALEEQDQGHVVIELLSSEATDYLLGEFGDIIDYSADGKILLPASAADRIEDRLLSTGFFPGEDYTLSTENELLAPAGADEIVAEENFWQDESYEWTHSELYSELYQMLENEPSLEKFELKNKNWMNLKFGAQDKGRVFDRHPFVNQVVDWLDDRGFSKIRVQNYSSAEIVPGKYYEMYRVEFEPPKGAFSHELDENQSSKKKS